MLIVIFNMNRNLFFLILTSIILSACSKDTAFKCPPNHTVYINLTNDEKKWLEVSSRDSVIFKDSIGNARVFKKSFYSDAIYSQLQCDTLGQSESVSFSNDSCP